MQRTHRPQSAQTSPATIRPLAIGRRDLLKSAGLSAALWPLASYLDGSSTLAAEEASSLNRFPRMVQEYFVQRMREADRRKVREYAELKTREDAERFVKSVQARIRSSFGPEPERTPLNPRITGVVERDTYRIEKIVFESRPGFPVTANLYVPKGISEPRPGVVGTCGHSSNGKASGAYQSFSQGLARLGYVCLIYDPIGQGERLQYPDENLRSRIGVGVREHLHAGNQQFLVGEFLGMWRAWDGIRALDYLLTREEVDPKHIGVTGNSGGGTMTTWLCGVEQRWTMAAPSCFVTTFRRNLENELPADTEQCPPRAIALGLDHCDFLAAMAPKPVIILAKERDYFDVRGVEEAYRRLKHLYALLGQEDNIGLFIGPTTHGFSQENREAMYGWFNRATGLPAAKTEPSITIEKDETLYCTPQGQVAELENTRTVFSFTRAKAGQLSAKRPGLQGEKLVRAVRRVLNMPQAPAEVPRYRILRHHPASGYPTRHVIAYAVETEPRVMALVYMLSEERQYSRPPRGKGPAVLYVAHRSSDEELRSEPLIREVMESAPQTPLFTCDVRGIGESRPNTCGINSFDNPYGCDYFYAIHSLMFDQPYLGQKTFDVLRVLDWLAAYGYTDVHLVGNGWGALAGTFAALLSDHVKQVTLKHALESYASVAQTEYYQWPLATLLPNVLARFDLPDCYDALRARKLKLIEPWGPTDGKGSL